MSSLLIVSRATIFKNTTLITTINSSLNLSGTTILNIYTTINSPLYRTPNQTTKLKLLVFIQHHAGVCGYSSKCPVERCKIRHCCRKGPLIIIKFPSLLLVGSRAARACLSVRRQPATVTVTGPGHWNGRDQWRGRPGPGLWRPGPGQSAVVAGPRLAESARGRVYGRQGPGPTRLSHPADGPRTESERLFAWSGMGTSVHLCVFLYAYQAFGFLLDRPF